MAISEELSVDGVKMYSVYVNLRSKTVRGLRAQRRASQIKTLTEARQTERRLIREAAKELASQETRECTWAELVGEFELYHRKEVESGRGFTTAETLKDYIAAIRKWTYAWSTRPVSSITEFDVRDVVDRMSDDGKSNSHQRKLKQNISKVFNFGMARRRIAGLKLNPAMLVKLARKSEPVQEVLNADQIRLLLVKARELEPLWYFVWAVALLTGMRNGELHALRWDDVDQIRRFIKVWRSFSVRHKRMKTTKSGAWRDVPISDELMVILNELKSTTGGGEYVLPRMWQWDQGQQAEVLRKFCIQIGLPSVRFHSLRASFATALLTNGVAPVRVMKICGWADIKTMAHYVRLAGVEVAGATDSLRFLTPEETVATVSSIFRHRK